METTMNYNERKNSNISFILMGVVLLIITLLFFMFSVLNTSSSHFFIYSQDNFTVEQIRVIEVVSGHAWSNHGGQVDTSFDCLSKNGSTRSFKTFGFKNNDGSDLQTNTWLCFDGNDWYAIVTTAFENIKGNKTARLVTAYLVSKEKYPEISNYINYLVSKWGAIEILYKINPSEILLQPK